MELSLSLATQIGSLFLMIFVGFVLARKQVISIKEGTTLSKLVLYVSTPAAIINAFQIELTSDRLNGFILSCVAAILIHILFIIITELFGKIFHFIDVEKASLIYSNCGNLIIPLVTIVLGEEMVFYCSGYMMVQTVLIWTHCKTIMSQQKEMDIRSIITNINMIAIFVGILLCIFHITLPTLFKSALNSAGNLMGPLSMIVVGMLLSGMNIKQVFTNKRAYLLTFFRLIIYPLIVLVIIYITRAYTLFDGADKVLMITMLAASAPSASTVTQFAQIYNNKPYESSIINTLTVLLCIITMPLINIIYTMLTGM